MTLVKMLRCWIDSYQHDESESGRFDCRERQRPRGMKLCIDWAHTCTRTLVNVGTFAATLVNVREVLVNMAMWVRQSLPTFARLQQSSNEGARMPLMQPGTCLNREEQEGNTNANKATRRTESKSIGPDVLPI